MKGYLKDCENCGRATWSPYPRKIMHCSEFCKKKSFEKARSKVRKIERKELEKNGQKRIF